MGQIKITRTPIEGLCVIEPTVYGDERGYFVETYNRQDMEAAGLSAVSLRTRKPWANPALT